MTKISDEIREWCNLPQAFSIPCDELHELADRIDREMVELPKDRSGVPINVGDTVYSPNGDEFCAVEIIHTAEGICVKCKASDATFYRFFPCDISHERLDSWKLMSTTSEERQEIAKMLRESVRAEDYLDDALVRAIYKVTGETKLPIGLIVMDLIDPMTLVNRDEHGRAYCVSCGCDDWRLAKGVRFCPNCGRRVVSNNE